MNIFAALRSGLALALLAALGSCGGGAAPAPAPVVIPPAAQVGPGTWVVMGSSTAQGAGAGIGKGWAALVAADYAARGVQVANIAKGGTVTYQGLGAASPGRSGRPAPDPESNIDQALSRKPVLLIVSYPTNDTAHGYSADETVHNLLAIRAQALAAKVPVVITSTQPRDSLAGQQSKLAEIDRKLAEAVGGCFVQMRQQLADANGQLAAQYSADDGVHLNDAGHRQVAALVTATLESGNCVQIAR